MVHAEGKGRGICEEYTRGEFAALAAGEFARFALRRIAAMGRGSSKTHSTRHWPNSTSFPSACIGNPAAFVKVL